MNNYNTDGQPLAGPPHLLVFARVPVLGRVKTRLAAGVGAEAALAVYLELLGVTRTAVTSAAVPVTVWLADTVGSRPTTEEAREWRGLAARSQAAGDLGQRMAAAFDAAFAAGAGRVVIIGTDCPGLTAALLGEAVAHLVHHDAVLGPATDGGYYLLGLRRPVPELFVNKAWSTASVLADTLADAKQLQLSVALLPELQDVDTVEDLTVWRNAGRCALESTQEIVDVMPRLRSA